MSRRTITVEVLSYDELKHAKHTNGVGELRTPLRRSLWSETEANNEELRQQRCSLHNGGVKASYVHRELSAQCNDDCLGTETRLCSR